MSAAPVVAPDLLATPPEERPAAIPGTRGAPCGEQRRLLFLSVSGRLGGAERVLLDALSSTRRRQPAWVLRVVSVEDGPLRDPVERLGIEYVVAPLPGILGATGEYGQPLLATVGRLAVSLPALAAYVRRLRKIVGDWRPDVVHANGLKAHVLSAWVAPRGTPAIWHVHDYVSHRRVSSRLFRRYSARASRILVNSRSVGEDVRGVVEGRAPVVVLHNGIDIERFSAHGAVLDLDAAAGLPAAPPSAVRVGLVATYARWKGQDVFLRALARLPRESPVRGYVVGGPVYQTGRSQWSRDELRRQAASLGLEQTVGFVPFQDDSAAVYRALDVVVHASTAPEPFGLVIGEAMACGRPVIVAAAGGALEVASPAATLSHPPGDVERLAAAIARLAGDGALRLRLGEAARASIVARLSRTRFEEGFARAIA